MVLDRESGHCECGHHQVVRWALCVGASSGGEMGIVRRGH